LSQFEKLLSKFFKHPIPNNITFKEAETLLLMIRCKPYKKKGTSHRKFKYPGYRETIVLMETEKLRPYQVQDIRNLIVFTGILEEEEE